MKKNYYTKLDASRAYYYVLIMQLLVVLVLTFVASADVDIKSSTESFFYLMFQYILTEAVFLGVFLYYNFKNSIAGSKIVGLKKKSDWLTWIICIVVSLMCLFLTFHFFGYFDKLLINIGFVKSSDPFVLDEWYKFIISVFILAILPAISEELIYRGIILKGLNHKGKISAVVLSSLFFAFMHMGVFQLFYQLYLAVIFAVVVVITKDIKLSMIMHFINNFCVLLFSFLQSKFNFYWFFGANINFWLTLLMFICCSALIVLFLYIIKRRNKNMEENTYPVLTKKENVMSNVGIWLTFAFYVFIAFSNSLISVG